MARHKKITVDDWISELLDAKEIVMELSYLKEGQKKGSEDIEFTTKKIHIKTGDGEQISKILAAHIIQDAIEGGTKERALLLDRAYGKSKIRQVAIEPEKKQATRTAIRKELENLLNPKKKVLQLPEDAVVVNEDELKLKDNA